MRRRLSATALRLEMSKEGPTKHRTEPQNIGGTNPQTVRSFIGGLGPSANIFESGVVFSRTLKGGRLWGILPLLTEGAHRSLKISIAVSQLTEHTVVVFVNITVHAVA